MNWIFIKDISVNWYCCFRPGPSGDNRIGGDMPGTSRGHVGDGNVTGARGNKRFLEFIINQLLARSDSDFSVYEMPI